jgi:hypothetical protein
MSPGPTRIVGGVNTRTGAHWVKRPAPWHQRRRLVIGTWLVALMAVAVGVGIWMASGGSGSPTGAGLVHPVLWP